ncbi:MAG: hypothetical protein E6Q62_06035 [Nitrosomonas sp.]|nr:MAG: hypothetical protein E6Q62_06035 [Nitrosomonas sp.]
MIQLLLFYMLLLGWFLPLFVSGSFALAAPEKPTRFAVIGDMPYSDSEYALLEQPDGAIAKAIKALNPPVLIHLGDFKLARASCSDELFKDRYRQIAQLNPHKTVYTPGDNDWTDCDRLSLNFSQRYDELERLAYLRQIFFQQDELQLSKDIPGLIRQQDFIENARWKIDQVLFASLHLPGTNNGRAQIHRSPIKDALDAADSRDKFNEEWLQQLFDTAISQPMIQAVVIAFHADIYENESDNKPVCTAEIRSDCDGYLAIRALISRRSAEFKKPVLVIHGDSLAYCLHQPYEKIPNLWRLNAPGDRVYIDANRIVFDSANKNKPFTAMGLLDNKPAPSSCGLGFLLDDLLPSLTSTPEKSQP